MFFFCVQPPGFEYRPTKVVDVAITAPRYNARYFDHICHPTNYALTNFILGFSVCAAQKRCTSVQLLLRTLNVLTYFLHLGVRYVHFSSSDFR